MKTNRLYFLLLPVIISACSHSAGGPAEISEVRIPVKVIPLQQQMVYEPVVASGSFTTDDETVRSFKTGGIVQHLFVREGDAVKKGQLLATLDLTEITSQVAQAGLAFEKAKRDFERLSNLYLDSVVTLEQFQNARTGLEIAHEQYTAAEFNRTFSEIRATEDGFVLKKFANEGQVVGPGTPVFLTNGAGDGNWILRAAISDRQWTNLSTGDSAVISTDLPDHKSIRGVVIKKSEGVDPATGTFTIDVRPIKNPGRSIASGMFGKVTITPSRGRHLWVIPYDALLDGDGSKGYVFVTRDRQTSLRVNVSVAGITHNDILIDSGLEGDSLLVVSGNAYLSDQSPIQVIQ